MSLQATEATLIEYDKEGNTTREEKLAVELVQRGDLLRVCIGLGTCIVEASTFRGEKYNKTRSKFATKIVPGDLSRQLKMGRLLKKVFLWSLTVQSRRPPKTGFTAYLFRTDKKLLVLNVGGSR